MKTKIITLPIYQMMEDLLFARDYDFDPEKGVTKRDKPVDINYKPVDINVGREMIILSLNAIVSQIDGKIVSVTSKRVYNTISFMPEEEFTVEYEECS